MKKTLFTLFLLMTVGFIYGQGIYYWIGGTVSTPPSSTGKLNDVSNWNSNIDGSGTPRNSNTDPDVLIFDGTNLGGGATGPAQLYCSSSFAFAQIKFINNADISMYRDAGGGGTSTLTLNGGIGEDLVIEAGSAMQIIAPSASAGSMRFTIGSSVDEMRVSGTLSMITNQQMSFRNGTSGAAGVFRFKSGATCITNISASSSSYGFGSSSQSSSGWVVFEPGSNLNYQGGDSPEGSGSGFSAIVMEPGSIWHHRANNATERGNFFNSQSYGDVIVENNATLTASGPIYRIGNLTVNTGCTFTTHTSGQTAVLGDVKVNGTLSADVASTNEIVLAGNGAQSISGTGAINVAGLIVGNYSNTTLNKNITVFGGATVYGKINFTDKQIAGVVDFDAEGIIAPTAGNGTTVNGSTTITTLTGIAASARGQIISGPGIPANTTVISVSIADDKMVISNPATVSAAGVALTFSSSGATLQSANTNGYNPASGSVVASGTMTFHDDLNYIIDGATTWPFGETTGSAGNMINAGFVDVNADITVNKSVTIKNNLLINGKMTLRPADSIHILAGADITGTFGATKYIATDYVTGTGVQSIVQYDGISAMKTIPVGTVNFYLPLTITPATTSDFAVAVFQGITTNGLLNGTPFTPTQRLRVVNAVWNVNRLSGSGAADLQLNWDDALEGTTFNTLPGSDIGLIRNIGSGPTGWGPPIIPGNNTTNIVMGNISAFGSFGAGAIPQVNAFIFNDLPVKTYGDPDFNGGATSLNTTNPITYTSSNPAVATIVSGNIHITGAGTADITASQIGDGVFPDTTATKTLTVDKAPLEVKADDKSRFEQVANPTLTITYTGFVLGETNAVLLTQPTITTTAVLASPPGMYPITVTGATAANYSITHVNGTLTVIAKTNQTITFPAPATKTYGNADFPTGATSTNSTIPITYTSSNPAVAIVTGNMIHITGGGTTTITAMQAGNDGYFPASNVARTLTVNKANLAIKANDATKTTGEANPAFSITYTGFVLGETAANLTTQPVISTTATASSSPGNYDLVPGGAVSSNYNITYTNGRLTVLPLTGTAEQFLLAYRNSNGNIAVRIYSPEPHLADIFVYSMNGTFIAKKNILMNNGFASAEIQAQNLAAGMYIISVKGNGVDLQKIIYFIK